MWLFAGEKYAMYWAYDILSVVEKPATALSLIYRLRNNRPYKKLDV
jgi:hypothetical protein